MKQRKKGLNMLSIMLLKKRFQVILVKSKNLVEKPFWRYLFSSFHWLKEFPMFVNHMLVAIKAHITSGTWKTPQSSTFRMLAIKFGIFIFDKLFSHDSLILPFILTHKFKAPFILLWFRTIFISWLLRNFWKIWQQHTRDHSLCATNKISNF